MSALIFDVGTGQTTFGEAQNPQADPVEVMTGWRDTAVCSRAQGKIALGQAEWERFRVLRDDLDLPWAMRVAADDTYEWRRNSQAMDEFAWLMGYDDAAMDLLFEQAMQVHI